MSGQLARQATKQVRPLISTSREEARRNVLRLYKAWQRNLLNMIQLHNLPISMKTGRNKIKEMFLRNKDVTDVRVIDMLTVKGNMELEETINGWKQPMHVMAYFKDTVEPRPKNFLGRFFSGLE
ncbi:NADH dehydrogenase [ubiquinone] 1 alpha subcomplex subunit 6 [Parasteatoda tepidariorum]|uniref:NADH dehydrogenase [ubiquinone] 1 alpha subcomplex subunit 6 n=1 Tax=Parasteatoda tepidariorum TaxID=114398 RepID=A0A2L2Y3L1_PARTP|nr:NADH dehydrogenase [ubiquinone] 1 alpha subcomplex subunit 6 [Parasteatoda tepidariorum]